MLTNILDRISFWSLFLVIVLMPVFFLPYVNVSVDISKSLLLVVGLAVSIIFWTLARFFDGEIVLPKSPLLLSGFFIIVVFFFSAYFSASPQFSFFGIMLDVGSFWFMFATFLLMFCSAVILKKPGNAKMVFLGVISSSFIVLLFQGLRFFIPEILSFGTLAGKTANLLGSWKSFGILAGFTAIISLFLVEFFFIPKVAKWALGFLIFFSALQIATVNFSFVWVLLGVSSLIIFVYKMSFLGKDRKELSDVSYLPFFSFSLFMIALLFFMSGQHIGSYLPTKLNLQNVEARPDLGATSSIAKAVILKNPTLGLGPNKFADAWAMHKPADINKTPFWDISFNTGSGLLTTLATTTGALGVLSLLIFFSLFLISGTRSLLSTLESGTNQEMTAFFVASLYLFIASFFYAVGPAIFLLAFAFTGGFIGLSSAGQEGKEIKVYFLSDPRKSFFFMIFLIFIMIASASLSFKYVERFVSVSYFSKAISSTEVVDVENYISRAINLNPNDVYYRTYSQVYLLKLNTLLSKGDSLSDEEKAELQVNFDKAISGATKAVEYNKDNYINFRALGSVYETIAEFGRPEAYDNALNYYKQSSDLNPLNPGLKLLLARVSFFSKKKEEAKVYVNEALSLKPDYIDAFIMLSQIAKSEGNSSEAISYAEKALSINPKDENLINYVNSLKNISPSTSAKDDKTKKESE
ncbi:tetratricopeptide repeat protein [Candidatus Nomurabacteria bacterium]|nr:tetratricopeptide repeat protein [Candidatus Nomurabacteria bacterium]